MMSASPTKVITLKSKLAPPRLTDTIPRRRLYPLLEGIETARAVTVTAGAGYGKTIDYLQRFVATDAYIETIYCRLMRLYHETGNHVMAVKTYEQCRYRLQTGLDAPPGDETEQLYREIVST